jgi:RNA polymerase sigma factor for flagellar operon FliA
MARRIKRRVTSRLEFADLVQSGMVGLLQAGQRHGRPDDDDFVGYATRRIRGAMLDAVRAADWSPRSLRRRERAIEAARSRIERTTGESASAAAIARAIGATLEDYFRVVWDISVTVPASLDDLASRAGRAATEYSDGRAGPAELLETDDLLRALAAAVDALPERERVIFLLYYDEDLMMREIGARLHVSESRICQIHTSIITGLRAAMRA